MSYISKQQIRICLLDNNFVPVNAESHIVIKNFNADNLLYEMTACLIVTWSDQYQSLYKIIDGFLCIANFYPNGEFAFLIARPSAAQCCNIQYVIDKLYIISANAGLNALYIREIEERFLEGFRQIKGYRMECMYNNDMSEYVFSAESLLNLCGRVNEEKRRQIRKFADKPNISFQPVTKANFGLCVEIEKKWCDMHDCDLCRSYVGCAKKTPEIMAEIFDASVYRGFLGYIDGIPAGYVIFEKYSEDIAYFYFAKTTVSNFSVFLYYNAVQRYLSTVKRINLGADVGKQGMRLFKKRLGAYEHQKKYVCIFTKEGNDI